MKELRRFLSIPVLTVFLVMSFVYYVTVFVFIEDWVGLETSTGTWNAGIFSVLAFMCVLSMLVSVVSDPGYVPSSYVPDVEATDLSGQQLNKDSLESRRCDKCCMLKPPRAHHCRICRRCVLNMDHHCVWIGNCVGYRNYKAFFLLVLYTSLASIQSAVVIICCALQREWNFRGRLRLKIFYIASGLMVTSLAITLGTLLGWHIYLVIRNMTTIEYRESVRAAWLAKKSGQSYRYPFDLGAYKNFNLPGVWTKHVEMVVPDSIGASRRPNELPHCTRPLTGRMPSPCPRNCLQLTNSTNTMFVVISRGEGNVPKFLQSKLCK